MAQSPMPKVIKDRLQKVIDSLGDNPSQAALSLAYNNILSIIASMMTVTSASLLKYDSERKHSVIVAEYHGKKSGVLERRSDIDEDFDERDYKIVYKWISSSPTTVLQMHLNQLPNNSTERREMQRYAVLTSLCIPVNTSDNEFWGYIELWESRYQRVFTQQEQAQIASATSFIMMLIAKTQD